MVAMLHSHDRAFLKQAAAGHIGRKPSGQALAPHGLPFPLVPVERGMTIRLFSFW